MRKIAASVLLTSVLVVATACGGSPSNPSTTWAGQWTGTTSQGTAIAFTVTEDLRLTSLTFGYSFDGCTGSLTYTPDVALQRIPTSPVLTYTAAYVSAPVGSPGRTLTNFLFTSTDDAHGMVIFVDFPGCESGTTATWTARKR